VRQCRLPEATTSPRPAPAPPAGLVLTAKTMRPLPEPIPGSVGKPGNPPPRHRDQRSAVRLGCNPVPLLPVVPGTRSSFRPPRQPPSGGVTRVATLAALGQNGSKYHKKHCKNPRRPTWPPWAILGRLGKYKRFCFPDTLQIPQMFHVERRRVFECRARRRHAACDGSAFFAFFAAGWCFQRRCSQKYCSGYSRIRRSRAEV
jgi:hypothetical protein